MGKPGAASQCHPLGLIQSVGDHHGLPAAFPLGQNHLLSILLLQREAGFLPAFFSFDKDPMTAKQPQMALHHRRALEHILAHQGVLLKNLHHIEADVPHLGRQVIAILQKPHPHSKALVFQGSHLPLIAQTQKAGKEEAMGIIPHHFRLFPPVPGINLPGEPGQRHKVVPFPHRRTAGVLLKGNIQGKHPSRRNGICEKQPHFLPGLPDWFGP